MFERFASEFADDRASGSRRSMTGATSLGWLASGAMLLWPSEVFRISAPPRPVIPLPSQTHIRDIFFYCLTGAHGDLRPRPRIAYCELSLEDIIPGTNDEVIPLIHPDTDGCNNGGREDSLGHTSAKRLQ